MTLTALTISGNEYQSLASLAEADEVLIVDPVRSMKWCTLTETRKLTYLIAATRRMGLLPWTGKKAGGATQNEPWPRQDMKYDDGTTIPDDIVPTNVVIATSLLAGTIARSTSYADYAQVQTESAQKVGSVKAGSVEVRFQDTAVSTSQKSRQATPPPLNDPTALQYVKQWLSNSGALSPPVIVGEFKDGNRARRYEASG